jgi:alanyl-tRNA synthetase
MLIMKSSEIRQAFIEFFEEKNHQFVPGVPIVPENDPTLLFINAGMNQFKDVFLETGSRDYARAVNSQVCVRVSGKHNDLEDVGKDSTHLTSFEMLGNWSFGDYYKKEAIMWAWEFLTKRLGIKKSKLVASVFEDDDDALEIWKTHTDINPSTIVKCDAKDNFWEMGATGPCGPCSEIHVYLEEGAVPANITQVDLNSGKFIELWNLVFIQSNRNEDGTLEPLPNTHVDTGAGLERLVAYMQHTSSNYETDLFSPVIKKIEQLTQKHYSDTLEGMPHRVIADHVRTLCFGIADNVMPSNEGRGYVLRRLLRRACRYAKKLGVSEPILYKCVGDVVDVLAGHFEHLKNRKSYIEKVIRAEEESFLNTLSAGLTLFDQVVKSLKDSNQNVISGEAAFKLYDTYGFPIDLTTLLAQEKNLTVDMETYNNELEKQKERSRQGAKFEQSQLKEESSHVTESDFEGLDLHLAEDLNIAKGGECRIISDRAEKVQMAQHHSATHLLQDVLRKHLGDHVHQAGSLVDSSRLRFDFSHFESISSEKLEKIQDDINALIQQELAVSISFSSLDDAKKKGVLALFGEKYNADRVRVVDIGGVSIELCAGTHVENSKQVEHVKIISESAISAGTRRIEALAGNQNINAFLISKVTDIENRLIKEIEKLKQSKQTLLDSDIKKVVEFKTQRVETKVTNNQLEDHLLFLTIFDTKLKDELKKLAKVQGKQNESTVIQLAKESIENAKDKSCFIQEFSVSEIADLRVIADYITNKYQDSIAIIGFENQATATILIKVGKGYPRKDIHAGNLIKEVTEKFGGGGGGRFDMAQAGGIKSENLAQSFSFLETRIQS